MAGVRRDDFVIMTHSSVRGIADERAKDVSDALDTLDALDATNPA